MGNALDVVRTGLDNKLAKSIDNATSIVTKNYLEKLESYEILSPSAMDVDIDVKEIGAFYKLTKLVWNKEENFLDKLTTIVDVAYSIKSSLVTIITSDGGAIDYYIGILSKEFRRDTQSDKERRSADRKAFSGALSGNMIGAEMQSLTKAEVEVLESNIFGQDGEKCISSVSGIVAPRNEKQSDITFYVQGIENLVDSLRGMKYTILMIADPISSGELQVIKRGYEMIHTQLAAFRSSSVTMSESDAQSLSRANTDGISKGISTGVAMTQSKTMSNGKFSSVSINGGVNIGIPDVLSVNAGAGYARGKSSGISDTSGRTDSKTESSQRSQSITETVDLSKTMGKSLQMNYENRTVRALLEKIDRYLERLDNCESYGAFDCASYCLAETREEAFAVASNYNAILRGKDSGMQASHINTWHRRGDTKLITKYLKAFVHPRFCNTREKDEKERIVVSPTSVVSGNELAIQVGFPKKSVNGITVIPMAAFGRNVRVVPENQRLSIGKLYHMGREDGDFSSVDLDTESLAMHTFITGSTGSGKSTMVYHMLDTLMQRDVRDEQNRKIKFLVIEPAKGEYKNRYGNKEDVRVFGSNPEKMPLLRINPFSFPKEIHVLEHIDRLIEIFNVCWPMYAAMPAVLKDAVERAYSAAGWDLMRSECQYRKGKELLYPTFADVLRQINLVMEESEYSADGKGDYKGALCTRVKSLTNGIYGQIFTSDEITSDVLFNENVIVDLSRIGSSETKSLIMGLLVMKLQEYRMGMGEREGINLPLRHVTVLEEAHHILKCTPQNAGQESANVVGKAVELLANSIAEMRTYGEGFIIADQSPGLMDMSAIRNTNTKIILRLPDLSDRELVGRAAGLSEEQILELSKLPVFVSAVYQNNWLEPVLCKLGTTFPSSEEKYTYSHSVKKKGYEWEEYVRILVMPIRKRNALAHTYLERLWGGIYQMNVSAETKIAFIKYLSATDKEDIQRCRRIALYGFFCTERAFALSRQYEKEYLRWYRHMYEMLLPDIGAFSDIDQQCIIANLAMENSVMRENEHTKRLFEDLMRNM